jgi:hypothetical protein
MFKDKTLLICDNCTPVFHELGKYHWKQLKPGSEGNDPESVVKKDDHCMDDLIYMANQVDIPERKVLEPSWLKDYRRRHKVKPAKQDYSFNAA